MKKEWNTYTVAELIKALQKIEDKDATVWIFDGEDRKPINMVDDLETTVDLNLPLSPVPTDEPDLPEEYVTVYSSHGTLKVNKFTGKVNKKLSQYDSDEIKDIESFNLREYRRYYGTTETGYDILDLGGKLDNGKTFKPCYDFRRQVALNTK